MGQSGVGVNWGIGLYIVDCIWCGKLGSFRIIRGGLVGRMVAMRQIGFVSRNGGIPARRDRARTGIGFVSDIWIVGQTGVGVNWAIGLYIVDCIWCGKLGSFRIIG